MSIKRNTTPTIPITVHLPYDKVEKIEFIFKSNTEEKSPVLLHKSFSKNDMKLKEGNTSESFTVLVELSCEETLKLPAGKIYVDSRPVLEGGKIPATKKASFYVAETFFNEVD